MDDRMKKIADAIYRACAETNFKVRFGRDHASFDAFFFRMNNESYEVYFSANFGWKEYSLNHEETVERNIEETEAMRLINEGFKEYGVVVSEV